MTFTNSRLTKYGAVVCDEHPCGFPKIPEGTPKSEWDQWPRESRLFAESGLTPAPWSDTRTQEQLFAELRVQRNKLLSESDWTQLPDAQVNAAAWATYRQALRDLPANTADPANPVWPTKP